MGRAAGALVRRAGWTGHARGAAASLDALQAASAQRDRRSGQKQLFAAASGGGRTGGGAAPSRNRIAPAPEYPEREKLRLEKEALGFFLSSNPLARYSEVLLRHCTARIDDLDAVPDGATVTVGGIAGKPRITVAKRGARREGMAMSRWPGSPAP